MENKMFTGSWTGHITGGNNEIKRNVVRIYKKQSNF